MFLVFRHCRRLSSKKLTSGINDNLFMQRKLNSVRSSSFGTESNTDTTFPRQSSSWVGEDFPPPFDSHFQGHGYSKSCPALGSRAMQLLILSVYLLFECTWPSRLVTCLKLEFPLSPLMNKAHGLNSINIYFITICDGIPSFFYCAYGLSKTGIA